MADGTTTTRHAAATAAAIVDTVGAGDAFAGGLAAALAGGSRSTEPSRRALRAAALSLAHAGARPP